MNRTTRIFLALLTASQVGALVAGCTASVQPPQVMVSAPPPPPPPPPPAYNGPAITTNVSGTVGVGTTGVVGVGVVGTGGGIGTVVSPTWTATGYNVNDWVSNNMTLRARQFGNGFIAITELVRSAMAHGERRTVVATVAAGHCYRIIGVGGPGVQDLDLYLRDLSGRVIDQDRAPDNFPVIGLDRQLCIPVSASAQLEIVMARGQGEIGVQVFGSP